MEMLAIYKGHSDAQEGVSKQGNPWRKITAVFETVEHYPKTIAVTGMNAMCETITQCIPGKMYRVQFDVESRSWFDPKTQTEKWFTDCKAWGIRQELPAAAPGVNAAPQTVPASGAQAVRPQPEPETNDLPF